MRPGTTPALHLLLATFALGIAGPAGAQQVAGASEVRASVDEVFSGYDRTDSPGCALGVMHDGELVYARGYGMANLDHGIALDPGSVFRIGSVSKQFTAAAIALAAQEGALSLDDDIRRWLPEMPEYGRPISVRMLLHHTSGIRDYLTLADLVGLREDDWYTEAEALELIARQRSTNFVPGSEFLYSNSGYFLLSQIIRRATGKTLREYAEERIFDPLDMNDTHFHDDHAEVVRDRASGYAADGDGYRISMTTLDMVGDGGVFTSVEDLLAWDRNFYEPSVGGRELLSVLLRRGVLTGGDSLDYALGLEHGSYRGLPVVSHGGAFVGFRADLVRFPEQRFSVATLCNVATADPTSLSYGVADLFLTDFLESNTDADPASEAAAASDPPVELSPESLSRWAGLYRDSEDGSYLRLEVRDRDLTVLVGPGYPLVAIDESRFRLEFAPVEFQFEEVKEARSLLLRQSGRESRYESVTPALLTPASASRYAGRYFAEELGTDYRIEASGEELTVRRGRGDPIPLEPATKDEFTMDGDLIVFEPANGQRPQAFTIDAGRVRGIRFERLED
jgi:CubicO group peptidase (beta-lactamase class C family)